MAMAIGQDKEFDNPAGLAVDRSARRLYVADTAKHQIRSYSTVDGSYQRTIGSRGTAPGTFNFPTNVFVDRLGRLYVTDTMNFRLQIFDTNAKLVKTFGEQGDTPGTLNRPKGVGVDSEGHIYIADTSFNNYQVFDDAGRLLLIVGSGGNGPGEFMLPAGLYVDTKDRIFVADQGNSRVQVFQYLHGRTGQ
jgi:DNA-binding beta-propeller fold protein YncE